MSDYPQLIVFDHDIMGVSNEIHYLGEDFVCEPFVIARDDHSQDCTLPLIVFVDLRNGYVEVPTNAVLKTTENPSLGLKAVRRRN